jgi:hypothetical protein
VRHYRHSSRLFSKGTEEIQARFQSNGYLSIVTLLAVLAPLDTLLKNSNSKSCDSTGGNPNEAPRKTARSSDHVG